MHRDRWAGVVVRPWWMPASDDEVDIVAHVEAIPHADVTTPAADTDGAP